VVADYGMSDRMGPVALGKKEEMVFLGRELGEERNYSEQTAREIDEEVRAIVQRALARAEEVLTEHKDRLIYISEELVRRETLEGPEFERLFTMPLPPGAYPSPSVPAIEQLTALPVAVPLEASGDAETAGDAR